MTSTFQPTLRTICLLFGGSSSEHEVSCVSASTFARHLNTNNYNMLKIGITKAGNWLATAASDAEMASGAWQQRADNVPCCISPSRADGGALLFLPDGAVEKCKIDVVIPVLHGLYGEDGTVQGLFALAGIPFVGCGVLASAACMDKAVTNALFNASGIPHCKWSSTTRYALLQDRAAILDDVANTLGFPIFVKPANAGSSVGVSKAADRAALEAAVEIALAEDDKVVFEEAIVGQEVECAVLGQNPPIASLPGEVLAGDEFYTYDDKYKNGVSRTVIPALLSPEKLEEVHAWALKAYNALGCEGLSRCDFFVEKGTGRVLINEINTFPGFTAISMYPKLMEDVGFGIEALIDALIDAVLNK